MDMQQNQHSNNGDESRVGFKLVGHDNFVRINPKSDRFKVKRFHHIEFWCGDAISSARRFSFGLGMPIVAKSDLSTGNTVHASYLLQSGDLNLVFTAPYSTSIGENPTSTTTACIPTFNHCTARSFSAAHGFGVRAIAIEVDNAEFAFNTSVSYGAKPSSPPMEIDSGVLISEVQLYGDVVLRYISFKNSNPNRLFLPCFKGIEDSSSKSKEDFGIRRLDHVANNVWNMSEVVSYVKIFTGFHEFAQFAADDIGTSQSGLNSVALGNNEESVLLNMTEPVYGTERKSQIQTFLEHNDGEGVQHLALGTNDIFKTLRGMQRRSCFGFEFLPPPPPTYYKNLPSRIGDGVLSEEEIKQCEELGVLVDKDDQGVLLQIFTKPVGDRPTMFLEIIQRVGCMVEDAEGNIVQQGGCGGFGKGNFAALFKSIEEYEKSFNP
ncbi:hypothetical protein MKW94_007794 [Papaver nudicaule]|uniref:4-hydroxyphenylpyruvate dioxygenase n=1 Tax=Papaver nudicaule TaxID=74823 RepID=A0AA41S6M2_PAPNU|nr:hypothetical protein [Papaver nudicaule]